MRGKSTSCWAVRDTTTVKANIPNWRNIFSTSSILAMATPMILNTPIGVNLRQKYKLLLLMEGQGLRNNTRNRLNVSNP